MSRVKTADGYDATPTVTVANGQGTAESGATIRTVVRGFTLNLFGGVTNAVLSLGFTLLVTHAFTVASVGVFFVVIGIFSTVIVVCQLGASATVVKTISQYRAVGRARDVRQSIAVALVPVTAFSLVVAVCLFSLAPAVAPGLVKDGSEHDTVVYLRVLAPFIPLAALMAVLLAATRGLGTMVPTVLLDSIAKPAFRVVLVACALVVGFSPAAFGALWAAPLALGFLFGLLVVLRLTSHSQPAGEDHLPGSSARRLFREFWTFTAPQWPAEIFQLAVVWIDVVLVGALVSSSAAGVYAAVSRLVLVGTLGLAALVLVLGPVLSRMLARGELQSLRDLYRSATVWLSAASIPVFLIMATFAPAIVQIFGDGYGAGGTVLSILSIGMLFDVVAGPALLTLLMGGRSILVLANTAAGFAANIGLNLGLIPPFGMTGAAVAWSVSIVLVNLLAVVQVGRVWGIRGFDTSFLIVAAGAFVCYGIGGLIGGQIGGQSLPTLLVTAAIGTVLYATVLWSRRADLDLGALVAALRTRTHQPATALEAKT
jgi:O-antigen/teichoic acid export membrane protein